MLHRARRALPLLGSLRLDCEVWAQACILPAVAKLSILTHFQWRAVAFAACVAAMTACAAERSFDLSGASEGSTPAGFVSKLSGISQPGKWQVVMDSVPPLLAPLSSNNPVLTKRPVLAQLSTDATDERFPMLIWDIEKFSDFRFSARVKTVSGNAEQMAGLVFRYQNQSNYTVLRISSIGNTLRFYKVANGERLGIITSPIAAPANAWHELAVECAGNQIRCFFDGKEYPPITDNGQSLGKVGFWTKSDAVSYFADAKITYTAKEMPSQAVVRSVMESNPKLLGLRIAVAVGAGARVVGSSAAEDAGQPASEAEANVLREGATYYGKEKNFVLVTMPLRDRNGEVIAAARVKMTTFTGQTEKNAVERAAPVVREMQAKVQSLEDLVW